MHLKFFVLTIFATTLQSFVDAGQAPTADIPSQLTLREAERLMCLHNPALRAEELNVAQERADLLGASNRPNPLLAFSSQGLSPRSEGFNGQELSLTVRLPIETADKRGKRVRVEESDVEIAASEYQNSERQFVFALRNAYFQLLLAQQDLKLAREILERFEGVVRLNRIRYEAGEISGGELRRAEAEQYRFFEDVVAAEVSLENWQDALLAQIGVSGFERPVEAVDGFDSSFQAPSIERLKEMALPNRQDLAAQRKRLCRSERVLELEKAGGVPDVIPFGGYRRDFGADGVIFGVEVPLFVFSRNQGAIARAGARIEQEKHRLRLQKVVVLRQVQANVYENDLGQIEQGQPVEVTSPAYPGRAFQGRLTYVGDVLDRDTRTVRVRCVVPNPERLLKLGMFVAVRIPSRQKQCGVAVPEAAIQVIEGQDTVFVAQGAGRFLPRQVSRGLSSGGWTIVTGLEEGLTLAAEGSFYLKSILKRESIKGGR